MSFSLDLTDDQTELRDWVHGFAADVVRPAAAEWDEREETPWPVIREAARIGLYGFESLAEMWADPTGLSLVLANEELFWGDSRHRDVRLRHHPRGGRDLRRMALPSRSSSGSRSASATRPTRRSRRSASPSPRPVRTSPRCGPGRATTRRPVSG